MIDLQEKSYDTTVAVTIVGGLIKIQCLNELIHVLSHIGIMILSERWIRAVASGVRSVYFIPGFTKLLDFRVKEIVSFPISMYQYYRFAFSDNSIVQTNPVHINDIRCFVFFGVFLSFTGGYTK